MSRLGRLLNPETRESQELRLRLPPPEAMAACRDAVRAIGWSAVPGSPEERRLTAHEDFTKLGCGDSPVRLEIELQPENVGRHSIVYVEAFVPGVGGVATQHLRMGIRAFAISLARQNHADGELKARPRPARIGFGGDGVPGQARRPARVQG